MKITVELVQGLNPCYDIEKLQSLIGDGIEVSESCVELALPLPKADCRWLLARLLNRSNRIFWANESAKRAKEYAARWSAYAAAYAAAVARWSAADAARWSAEDAADAAADAARWSADAAA